MGKIPLEDIIFKTLVIQVDHASVIIRFGLPSPSLLCVLSLTQNAILLPISLCQFLDFSNPFDAV